MAGEGGVCEGRRGGGGVRELVSEFMGGFNAHICCAQWWCKSLCAF